MIPAMNRFVVRFCLLFTVVFGALFLLVWFYMSITAAANAAELSPPAAVKPIIFGKGSVRIISRYKGGRDIKVEIATTPEQLSRGLMFRKHLDANAGMLFVYKPPRVVGMWMKNTLISLDIVFAAPSGRVIYIAQNTTPLSEKIIQPPLRTAYVLELPAGTIAARGIDLGARLTY